jgi:hypothetical protein
MKKRSNAATLSAAVKSDDGYPNRIAITTTPSR